VWYSDLDLIYYYRNNMKKRYVIVPAIVIAVALIGQYFTGQGMDWYATLRLHSWNPSGLVIGMVRTVIFVLGAISTILFWTQSKHDKTFGIAISLFVDNIILNILRSWLFFVKHRIIVSIVEMILLWIVTVLMILAVWKRSRWSAYLLFPYALWLMIATFFVIRIYLLN